MRLHLLLAFVFACGGSSGSRPDAGPEDPSPDAAVDAAADAAADAPIDADPNATAIATVTTVGGQTQICQGCIEDVVITGANLELVTAVRVGASTAIIGTVTATEVRAKVRIDTATAFGFADVSVDTPSGVVTKTGAIEITAITASPNAPLGGHGVPQSPIHVCDPELQIPLCSGDPDFIVCPHAVQRGETLHLLAGTHTCNMEIELPPGITFEGAGAATTTLEMTNSVIIFGETGISTLIRNLRFAGANGSVRMSQGRWVIQSVIDAAGGLNAFDTEAVNIDGYTYTGPTTRNAIEVTPRSGTSVAIANSHITGCSEGIVLHLADINAFANLTIDSTIVERCTVGARIGIQPSTFNAPQPIVQVTGLQLLDNATGMIMHSGSAQMSGVVIRDDEATAPAITIGMVLTNGDATLTDVTVEGQTTGFRVSSAIDTGPLLALDGATVVGGSTGIQVIGGDSPGIKVRRSTVRDQTVASIALANQNCFVDLGTPADPGMNALSVVSGFAVDDQRQSVSLGRAARAIGTTLNGTSLAGQLISGPTVQAPRIRIADSSVTWQF